MLKSTYGSLIIKKDTILYHATDEEYSYKPEKKLLYTIFHPSEWVGYDSEYIVRIQLKRDIEVLFFISGFRKHYILSNQEEKKSAEFLEKLGKENLDGWLASIENRSHVEVAILKRFHLRLCGKIGWDSRMQKLGEFVSDFLAFASNCLFQKI